MATADMWIASHTPVTIKRMWLTAESWTHTIMLHSDFSKLFPPVLSALHVHDESLYSEWVYMLWIFNWQLLAKLRYYWLHCRHIHTHTLALSHPHLHTELNQISLDSFCTSLVACFILISYIMPFVQPLVVNNLAGFCRKGCALHP